jgi:AbrB family looped-hinge helix DNA binding protein
VRPRLRIFDGLDRIEAIGHFDILTEWQVTWDHEVMARTVSMNEQGRITLPAELRRELGLEGISEFEIEVDPETDALILRPAVVLRREDAWAYTPEHRALLKRAHADSRAGRVRRMTEEELRKFAGID